MPKLEHARHEAFCQAYARSKSLKEAAREAGFKGGKEGLNWSVRGSELMRRPYIKARVDEINQELVRAATKSAKVDRAWVLEQLKSNAEEALEHRDRAAANRALELLGKEMGMFVDRKMVLTGPLEALDAPRLQRLLALAQAAEEGRLVLPSSSGSSVPMIPASSSDPIDKSGEILELEAVEVPERLETVPEALEDEDDDVLG